MKRFTQLFFELDGTTRTSDKVRAIARYFHETPPADAAWALFFLTGRKIKRAINSRLLRQWAADEAQIPGWMLDDCHEAVGDLSETLALILPRVVDAMDESLHEVIEDRLIALSGLSLAEQEALVRRTWREMDPRQRLVWHKLILGEFRVGVAQSLVARALAQVAGIPPEIMAHRLMGDWRPTAEVFAVLLNGGDSVDNPGQPYPFFLAHPLQDAPNSLGALADWQAEWKWDGIRAQLIRRNGQVLVWSRGEELITDRFPEVAAIGSALPDGVVLDGEIMAWRDDHPLPFAVLQRRIGRKSVGPKLLSEAPVSLVAYDLLENKGQDILAMPLVERRRQLEVLVNAVPKQYSLRLSPEIVVDTWDELIGLRNESRERLVEGIMLKRRDSSYGVGRPRGDWWKWKVSPFTIDAVMIYAQRGHGRRASLYTDYTFGVWDQGELVPIAKAYSGLTDEEIVEVDRFVRDNTLERFGPVRAVRAELVFELHFEGIQMSTRHKSGLALRFPRMGRWRHDKRPSEADSLETLRALSREFSAAQSDNDEPSL